MSVETAAARAPSHGVVLAPPSRARRPGDLEEIDLKAFVLVGPREWRVEAVDRPVAAAGQVVVDVARVGLCGTDVEFFTGDMAYLHQGHASYPIRIGHEWTGTVTAVGEGVDAALVGRRVIGDTMLGCGHCARCVAGRQHLCADRFEIGIRRGWPGALAGQLVVPATALHLLPDSVDDQAGALVEPGGNAWRAVMAALHGDAGSGGDAGRHGAGVRVLVWGAGTIGLLAAMFARSQGADVHVIGRSPASLALAASLGLAVSTFDDLPGGAFEAVIDATNDASVPAMALDVAEPGGRVVYIGLAGEPSHIDSRTLALKDVTAIGILGGSDGLAAAIEEYASGRVDPRPLVAATVGLDEVGAVLGGWRPANGGRGPKIQVDPSR